MSTKDNWKKVKKFLDNLFEDNQKAFKRTANKYNFSLHDIQLLKSIYDGETTEFINGNIHSYLEDCGIPMKTKGIGWTVLN